MRISGPCPMKVLHNKGLMGTHKIARQHGILHGRLWEPLASWLACLPSDSHGYPERRSGKYFLSFQELSRCHAPNAARNLFKIGQRKSRYRPDELARRFATMLFPRTTNRYGCVTLHSYHFYVEEGLPQTQVLLWVYGEQLRAVFEDVVVAESHCRYDGQTRKVHDIRDGVVYPTRFLSPQGTLIPLNAREVVVVYRSTPPRPRAAPTLGGRQLLLFARASAGGWEVRLGEHGAGHGRRHARRIFPPFFGQTTPYNPLKPLRR